VPFSEISEKAPSASDLSNYRIVHEGQLLENRMQAWNGMFIRVNRSGCVSPDYSVFNASADRYVNVKFYEYVFRSPLQVEQFANASRGLGTGFNRLYTPAFGAIYTIYPPQIEQDAIVKYLDNLAQKFDVMIQKKEEQIERLKELKTLLISDAVFGKVNVTGVHVPEYEYLTEELDSDFDDDIEETEEQED
ncbi:MAG: restriction endonuclease subunit S, partial [Clostridia bacterium]|nr:restriction endonuclease subunit S [Clostridia bacterium]